MGGTAPTQTRGPACIGTPNVASTRGRSPGPAWSRGAVALTGASSAAPAWSSNRAVVIRRRFAAWAGCGREPQWWQPRPALSFLDCVQLKPVEKAIGQGQLAAVALLFLRVRPDFGLGVSPPALSLDRFVRQLPIPRRPSSSIRSGSSPFPAGHAASVESVRSAFLSGWP